MVAKESLYPGHDESEWVFIDDKDRDRFTHDGDTIVPGSGKRWSFAHRRTGRTNGGGGGRDEHDDAGAVVERGDENEEELPWQLIAILSGEMLNKLRRYYQWCVSCCRRCLFGWLFCGFSCCFVRHNTRKHTSHYPRASLHSLPMIVVKIWLCLILRCLPTRYEYDCRMARNGNDLAKIEAGTAQSTETEPPSDFQSVFIKPPNAARAEHSREAGKFDAAAKLFESVIAELDAAEKDHSYTPDTTTHQRNWRRAYYCLEAAKAHRRAFNLTNAIQQSNAALALFPCFAAALLEQGLIHLDNGDGHYQEAIDAFERVLRVDRAYPNINTWLCRAHAHLRREALEAKATAWQKKLLSLEDRDAEKRKKWQKKAKEAAKRRAKAIKKREKEMRKKLARAKAKRLTKQMSKTKRAQEREVRDAAPKLPNPEGDEGVEDEAYITSSDDSDYEDGLSSVSSVSTVSTDPSEEKRLEIEDLAVSGSELADDGAENADCESTGRETMVAESSAAPAASELVDDDDDIDDIDDIDGIDDVNGSGTSATSPTGAEGGGDRNSAEDNETRWASSNHYTVLRVPADFAPNELTKAFVSFSWCRAFVVSNTKVSSPCSYIVFIWLIALFVRHDNACPWCVQRPGFNHIVTEKYHVLFIQTSAVGRPLHFSVWQMRKWPNLNLLTALGECQILLAMSTPAFDFSWS